MKRLHLIEIHDQDWCPRTVRDGETDYLQFVIWDIGTVKGRASPIPITYLIGVPNEKAA